MEDFFEKNQISLFTKIFTEVMCGIAGIYNKIEIIPFDDIKEMTEAIKHRGPDGEGFFLNDNIALGHRRLKIIDLETGDQPMGNEDGHIQITFNGEIYNYIKLRDSLKNRGHVFKTHSDTECIIHGYEEWGFDVVNKLRGMFAFAIADLKEDRLFLARDPFGIKPLVYRVEEDSFSFASEINALRVVEKNVPDGNREAIILYLRMGYIPAPHTIYQNIYKLPPAHYLVYDFKSGKISQRKYFDLAFKGNTKKDKDWLEEAEEVLKETVEAHLISDVPFGVFLSGGIDSTLVSMQMASLLDKQVDAFSIGFHEEDYSELKYAKQAAGKIGIKLHYDIVEHTELQFAPMLINQHYGEPFADSSMLPTWYISRFARQFVPLVLSGDGGDEFFGGYTTYLKWLENSVAVTFKRKLANDQFCSTPYFLLGSLKKYILNGFSQNHLDEWITIGSHQSTELPNALNNDCKKYFYAEKTTFQNLHKNLKKLDKLSYVQAFDMLNYLPNDILTKVDIASMAHGLEVRPPIIDRKVAEFVFSLPFEEKVGKIKKVLEAKFLLKKILLKEFPAEFVLRAKQGFSIPNKHWMQNKATAELFKSVIFDKSSRLHEFFVTEKLCSLFKNGVPDPSKTAALWSLFVLGVWLENHRDIRFLK